MNEEENLARRHRFGEGGPSALLPARLMCVLSLLLLVVIITIGRAA